MAPRHSLLTCFEMVFFKRHSAQRWAIELQKAVQRCDAFIPLCSVNYGSTEWTYREYQLADQKLKKIMPVWHSGPFPPPALEIFLSGLQRVPRGRPMVESDFSKVIHELLVSLKQLGIHPRRMAVADCANTSG